MNSGMTRKLKWKGLFIAITIPTSFLPSTVNINIFEDVF